MVLTERKGHDPGQGVVPLEGLVPFKMKVVSKDGETLEYVGEGKWRSSCLMILISSVREQIISSSKTADVGGPGLEESAEF